ncbi:MAG TPA: SRPBCC family protein [Pyrinomonadaceae bacterium]|nr:SRPBCC family protein [Pyrinomonadaceae bacterium]
MNNVERAASAIAGSALVVYGVKLGGVGGTLLSILGGGMLFRGTTGHCHMYGALGVNTAADVPEGTKKSPFTRGSLLSGKIHVTKALTINKSAAELYEFWRNFENLPIFMRHLESVTKSDETFSHWKAKAPLGQSVEWDAEVTSDIPNQRIGWKSLDGAFIPNSGVVEFLPTANRGTELKVTMTYEAPGGKLGEWIAWALGEEPHIQIAEDLRRFKSLMETGLIMKTEGQPSGSEPLPKAMTAGAR